MSDQKTLKGSPNVISSRELEDGVEHYNSQDGVQTDLFGREVLHANRSAQQEAEKERMTSDTSGLSSSILSESANLQRSLENRLRQLSDSDGSMIYKTTLRQKVTPQGRSYFHLAASARTTKGIDSSLPPSAWLTPTTSDMNGVRELDGKRSGGLNTQAQSAWPTPLASDQRGSAGVGKKELPNIAKYASGKIPKSSTAETESTAPSQLNPRFSLWLMGYPIEWAYSGERVTPLSRKRQQKS